jgi:hypothetical protein
MTQQLKLLGAAAALRCHKAANQGDVGKFLDGPLHADTSCCETVRIYKMNSGAGHSHHQPARWCAAQVATLTIHRKPRQRDAMVIAAPAATVTLGTAHHQIQSTTIIERPVTPVIADRKQRHRLAVRWFANMGKPRLLPGWRFIRDG